MNGTSKHRQEFEALVRLHLDAMYRTALRMCRDPSAAEDLVQECCLRAYRSFESFRTGSNFKAWIFRILVNLCIDRARRERAAPTVSTDSVVQVLRSDTPWSNPERGMMASDLRSDISTALAALPPELRMVVLLVLVEELSYAEAAEVLKVPVSTVRSRLHRAREALRVLLASHGDAAAGRPAAVPVFAPAPLTRTGSR